MVRGTQKKVVYLKNTGSAVFDEAFFIVKDEKKREFSEEDFLREANRIVAEKAMHGHAEEKGGVFLPAFLFFLFGMLFSIFVSAAAFFLF